jgi:hypothetical protein
MDDNISVSSARKALQEVSLQCPNPAVQKHALNLLHDLDIFHQLKVWSNEIMASDQDPTTKAEALVNLRVVGSMALNSKSSFYHYSSFCI